MTVVNPKSISGINSITTGSGSDDLLTIHNNNGTERFRVDGSGNTRITSGIVTTISIGAVSSVGAISGDISIDDKIIHNGDTNTTIRFPSDDTIQFETSGTDRLKISSTGVISAPLTGVVALGNQSTRVIDWSHKLQVEGTDETSSISIMRNSNDVNPPYLTFCKSRGTEVGATTIVQNNDLIANIQFKATDGNAGESTAAQITAEVDATPGDQDMPGRLVFKTTPDGSAAAVERLRINSVGKVGINSTSPDGMLAIEHTSSAPNLTMRNHPAAGPYTNEYGMELRHAYGSVKHGALIHTQEAADGRRSLDVSDSNGVFATFANGKVGINTYTPNNMLHINGLNGSACIKMDDNGQPNRYGKIFNYAEGIHLQARNNTSKGNIVFRGEDAGATVYYGRFTENGLCFGSDSAAANALDDYEEGTWTGAVAYAGGSGWSTSEGNGKYIKIGHQVHCTLLLSWNEGSGSGAVTMTGLPFTIKNDSHVRLGGHAIYLDGFSGLSGSNIFLYNTGNSTIAYMYYVSGDNDSHLGPSDSQVTDSNTSNANTTRWYIHYQSA